uniref:Uncharacterized protein n=1 Tax=Setaria italica TaxID=4555 RepID=K3ZE88_SETIT
MLDMGVHVAASRMYYKPPQTQATTMTSAEDTKAKTSSLHAASVLRPFAAAADSGAGKVEVPVHVPPDDLVTVVLMRLPGGSGCLSMVARQGQDETCEQALRRERQARGGDE